MKTELEKEILAMVENGVYYMERGDDPDEYYIYCAVCGTLQPDETDTDWHKTLGEHDEDCPTILLRKQREG